jgi:hypothetical protein
VAKDWIMVRIGRNTHQHLQRVRQSLRVAEELHLVELEIDTRDRVSLDAVIDWLIGMYDRHAERRRRSAARRRSKRIETNAQADTLNGGPE